MPTRPEDAMEFESAHRRLLDQAARLVGQPVRAVQIDWPSQRLLAPCLSAGDCVGVATTWPHCDLEAGPRGLSMRYGLAHYRMALPGGSLSIVHVKAPASESAPWQLFDFWAVPAAGFRRFYRFMRRLERESTRAERPILSEADARALWSNTIGFLRHARVELEKFNVPQKRGVFLCGAPGNGKTLASRWLLAQCRRYGLCWNCVTPDELRDARLGRRAAALFELPGPGIVLFDDLDQALVDRHCAGTDSDLALFLTELDGVHARDGVVYLFTSNLDPEELDPAMNRPGRIDFTLRFKAPAADQRRQLMIQRWHAEIVAALDIEAAVAQTEGLSFAQLEEIKKLLVMGRLEHGRFDWQAAWGAFCAGNGQATSKGRIGFAAPERRRLRPLHSAT